MNIWIDAQLSPTLASWLSEQFEVTGQSVRSLGLRDAEDTEIFEAARIASAVVMTKDKDFVELVTRLGAPPQVLWITCGNSSNRRLREILMETMEEAILLLEKGESIVEISSRS